jgi:hypothetical protein
MPVYQLLSLPIKELRKLVYEAYQTNDICEKNDFLQSIYIGLNGSFDDNGIIVEEKLKFKN